MRFVTAEILSYCHIESTDAVLVGLSGGADSVCLLYEMLNLMKEHRISRVFAAHMNHGIRGDAADHDEAFCRALCETCDVPLYCETVDVPKIAKSTGQTVEEAARNARYAFFDRAKTHFSANCIVTAHHKDDQAETVLMHLIRGSTLRGLCGMKWRTGSIARPLLFVSREQIEKSLAERGVAYCTDETNFETDAFRNKIRLALMPLIRSYNPAFSDAVCRMTQSLSADETFLTTLAEQALTDAKAADGYWKEPLFELPVPIKTRAVRSVLLSECSDITGADIRRVCALLAAKTGTAIELSGGRTAWVDSRLLHVGRLEKRIAFDNPFSLDAGTAELPMGRLEWTLADRWEKPENANQAYIDLDALPDNAVIRDRRDGDRFHPVGAPGTKKLSDYFIDKKVPQQNRNVPLLCCGNDVFVVFGHTIAESVKVRPTTAKILFLWYTEEVTHDKW